MTDLEKSMEFERAFADISHVIVEMKTLNARETEQARREGREKPTIFKDWIGMLNKARDVIRNESDEAFLRHKANHPNVTDDGIEALANAILERAAIDYQSALCANDEFSEHAIFEIESFADNEAHLYTTLDFPEVLEIIREKHDRFCRKAHKDLDSLLFYTQKNKRHGHHDKDRNPHRCPMCGGGMYVKKTGGVSAVVCTMCEMREVVKPA